MDKNKVKDWFKDKADDVRAYTVAKRVQFHEWAKAHPYETASIGIAGLGAVVEIVRRIDRNAKRKREEDLKERYVYDRSLGSYWHLRRKPTQREQLEIERRKNSGEKYGAIFTSMKLL